MPISTTNSTATYAGRSRSSPPSRSQSVPTLSTGPYSSPTRSSSRDTARTSRSQSPARTLDSQSSAPSTPPTSRSRSRNSSRSRTQTENSQRSSRPTIPATTASLASAINTFYTHLGSITFEPDGTAPWNALKGTMSFSTLGGDAKRCQTLYTELTGQTSQPSHKPNLSLSEAVSDARSGLKTGTFDEKTNHDDFRRYMRHIANFSNDLETHRDANRQARKAAKQSQYANTSRASQGARRGNSTATAGAKPRNRRRDGGGQGKPARG